MYFNQHTINQSDLQTIFCSTLEFLKRYSQGPGPTNSLDTVWHKAEDPMIISMAHKFTLKSEGKKGNHNNENLIMTPAWVISIFIPIES